MECWSHLKSFINKEFPFWKDTANNYPINDDLLFERSIPLNQQVFQQCHHVIQAFWKLRQNLSYQKYVKEQSSIAYDPGHYSILMCYDFHVTETGIKLIEINTNASFAIVIGLLSQKNKNTLPIKTNEQSNYFELLKGSISEEISRFGLNTKDICIAIIDDEPEKQKAYFEFQYYKAIFEYWGWQTFICDPSELRWNTVQQTLEHTASKKIIHFIYNRCCDFLFEDPKNQHLRQAFLSHATCFSPNPYEYSLLADKQRFIDLSKKDFLETLNLLESDIHVIKDALPYSFSILDLSKDQLWSQRRNLFFKPKRLYGSKGAFRGMSISKSKLASIYNREFMAQDYIPPSLFEDYKYDLRIYTYKSDIHLAAARVYKGQVTNASTGGLALIDWKK